MTLSYASLMTRTLPTWRFRYEERDVLLYNLSVGMGRDPADLDELPFVFEQPRLRAVPTVATVLGRVGATQLLDGVPLDWRMVLHGEQRLTLHRPIPGSGELIGESRIAEITDKGKGKGATITVESDVRLADGVRLYTTMSTIVARGDDGCGGPRESRLVRHAIPDRAADLVQTTETWPGQALLYRLNGDRNPLHADPAFAQQAGFARPILHGLCTYGIACRAILASLCDHDDARIGSFDIRFTAPVFPGETIDTEIWLDGDIASFRCRVAARGVIVVDNGRCRLNPATAHA